MVDLTQDGNSSSSIILSSVRDVSNYWKLHPSRKIQARLQGIITRVINRGGIIFLNLFDGTGTIQVLAERTDFGDSHWALVRQINQSARIIVTGQIGTSRSGHLSLFLKSMPTLAPELRLDLWLMGSADPERIGAQIYLARTRALASEFFAKQEFIELEPTFLSASWETRGLIPLGVEYPGFGPPAFLVPSPVPQILKALVITGKDKVFCVSRNFTSTYRYISASYESPILCAIELGGSLDHMWEIASDAIRQILSNIFFQPMNLPFLTEKWSIKEFEKLPNSAELNISSPEIQVFRNAASLDPEDNIRNISVFRVCWPSNAILAEGASRILGDGILLGMVTIHIERLVLLLRSDIFVRTLGHQSVTTTKRHA